MNTNQKLLVIRFSYWLGAIMDALFALVLTAIAIFGLSIPFLTNIFTQASFIIDGGLEYRFAMGLGAGLMWGWTVLLLWADQKPVERKGILLITVFPVIAGLFFTNILAILNGLVTVQVFLLRLIIQFGLMVLLFISYRFAGELEN